MEKYSDQQLRTMVAQARAIAAQMGDAETKAAFLKIADGLEQIRCGIHHGLPKGAVALAISVPPAGESSR